MNNLKEIEAEYRAANEKLKEERKSKYDYTGGINKFTPRYLQAAVDQAYKACIYYNEKYKRAKSAHARYEYSLKAYRAHERFEALKSVPEFKIWFEDEESNHEGD